MALAVKMDDLNATRRSLLERVKNWEDQEGWKRFFDTYSRLVYSVALQAGLQQSEAEDVVQETMIGVAKNIREFHYDPAIGKFRNWLIHTTEWRIRDQFRKRQKLVAAARTEVADRTATIERVPDPASLNVNKVCEQEWQNHLQQLAIEKVKEKVSAKHFQIFDLHVVKHWPPAKVANTLGITSARVYLVKHRLMKLVGKELESLKNQAI